ncbi:hypothetical protein U1Q18_024024 [Sarracenia purpurea var. burkii]
MGGNSAINPNRVAELNGCLMAGGSQPLSGELERATLAVEENYPQIERLGDIISKRGAPILEEEIQTKSRGKQIMEGINSAGYDGGKSDQITRIRAVLDIDGDTPRYFTAVEEGGGFIPLTSDCRIISYEEGVTEGKRYTELAPIHSGEEPQPDFKANVEQKRGMLERSLLVEMERTKMGRMARDGMDYTKGTDTEVSHMEIESSQHFTFSSNQDKEAFYQSQRTIPTDANIQTSLRRRKAWARKARPTTETKQRTPLSAKRQLVEAEGTQYTGETKKAKVHETLPPNEASDDSPVSTNIPSTAEAVLQPCRSP